MSKIGRKPVDLQDIKIDVQGQDIHYTGKQASGVHHVPKPLTITVENNTLRLFSHERSDEINRLWGLHRALLANELVGARGGFERQLKIEGLGFKAAVTGDKIVFSLGYSHKIDFDLPKGVTATVDKTGQNLVIKGTSKEEVGLVCSQIRQLRPPEPYKGTGIRYAKEKLLRKSGKAKSA